MKKLIKITTVILVLFMIASITAISVAGLESTTSDTKISSGSKYNNYNYVLDSYDVNIVVNEDNTFNITETIGAYFNVSKHGIFRSIPLKNKVERVDGTTSINRVNITNINVNEPYTTSVSNGNKVLQIGDANATLTGAKKYVISYTYNLGKDTGKNYDEFYFNLIGSEWEAPISGITFTITMPKEFDASKLGFSSGSNGTVGSYNVIYEVNGNVITGRYNGVITPGQALTARLELPEGYFVNSSNNFDLPLVLSFILPIILMLICLYMWYKFGRDEKVIETVEFYPPEGLNSADVGFIYKGKADKNDVISLLVYLADKGYIKIVEQEDKTMFSRSNSFKLIKIKEYDGNDENEKSFFTGLFDKPKSVDLSDLADILLSRGQPQPSHTVENSRDEITSEDLKNKFYTTLNKILNNLNYKDNKEKIFEKTSLSKRILVVLMIAIVYVAITVAPILEYSGIEALPFALLFPAIGFTALFAMVFGKTKIPVKIFGLIWGLGFGGAPWVQFVLPSLLANPLYLVAYIIGIICVLVMVLTFDIMPKRTTYGTEMLGKIRGFKTFLETAEKPKLEELVMQNPSYFYNILPYTYVLGVSDKWIKNFESIAIEAPDWYYGNHAFNVVYFGSFMHSTMSTANEAMASVPAGGSVGGGGGGFSGGGGGFSGGGSGGGGGGSW